MLWITQGGSHQSPWLDFSTQEIPSNPIFLGLNFSFTQTEKIKHEKQDLLLRRKTIVQCFSTSYNPFIKWMKKKMKLKKKTKGKKKIRIWRPELLQQERYLSHHYYLWRNLWDYFLCHGNFLELLFPLFNIKHRTMQNVLERKVNVFWSTKYVHIEKRKKIKEEKKTYHSSEWLFTFWRQICSAGTVLHFLCHHLALHNQSSRREHSLNEEYTNGFT